MNPTADLAIMICRNWELQNLLDETTEHTCDVAPGTFSLLIFKLPIKITACKEDTKPGEYAHPNWFFPFCKQQLPNLIRLIRKFDLMIYGV
jgi:hypothetical protein